MKTHLATDRDRIQQTMCGRGGKAAENATIWLSNGTCIPCLHQLIKIEAAKLQLCMINIAMAKKIIVDLRK